MEFIVRPLGIISSEYKEKFAIPRQSLLASSIESKLILERTPFNEQAIDGLEQFEYLHLIWIFHEHLSQDKKPKVRPPRLGGVERLGIWATRSPHRPNNLGLSIVKLSQVKVNKDQIILHLLGADLVDGTPVVDIKPYIQSYDSIQTDHKNIWETLESPKLDVEFSEYFLTQVKELGEESLLPKLSEILQCDPIPRSQRDLEKSFKFRFSHFDIEFICQENSIKVLKLIQS